MGDQGVCKGCQFEDEDKNRPECLNCRRRLGLDDETAPEVKKTSETKPDQKNTNEKIEKPVNMKSLGKGKALDWIDTEIQFLRDNVDTMHNRELAKMLGRTESAVSFRLSIKNIQREGRKRRKRKDPEKKKVRDEKPPETIKIEGKLNNNEDFLDRCAEKINKMIPDRFRSLFFVDDDYQSTALVVPAIRAVGIIKPGAVLRGESKEFVFEIPVADYRRITCRYRDMETATKMRTALLVAIENYYHPGGK